MGGTLSGLAAAARLARVGVPVLLFDDSASAEPRARCDGADDIRLGCGLHRLYEHGAAMTGLRELGISIDAVRKGPNGGYAIWRGAKHTLPVGFCSLLTTGLFALGAKIEIARFLAALPALDSSALHGVAVARWLPTQLRDPLSVQFALALVRFATCANDPERQSAAAAVAQLKLSLTGSSLYVPGGWDTLVRAVRETAASGGATIVSGGRVVGLKEENGRVLGITLANGRIVGCRAVIVAGPPAEACRLLGPGMVAAPPAAPVCVAALGLALRRLPVRCATFALGIDDPVSYSADSAAARQAPEAEAVVHIAKYLGPDAGGSEDDETELERIMDLMQPGWRAQVVHRRFVHRLVVSDALVTATSGGLTGRPDVRVSGLRNVFLAGDWVGATGELADAAIASGLAAARSAESVLASS